MKKLSATLGQRRKDLFIRIVIIHYQGATAPPRFRFKPHKGIAQPAPVLLNTLYVPRFDKVLESDDIRVLMPYVVEVTPLVAKNRFFELQSGSLTEFPGDLKLYQ